MALNLLKSLISVVGGNLLYFFVLAPHLPQSGRHMPFRMDLGLVIDFWVCLVMYGLVEVFWRRRKKRMASKS